MRSGIHPALRPVVFRDRAAGFQLLTRSTVAAQHTVVWEDGTTYPVVDVDISSASHPFYTGTSRVVDTAGRVERFERRYGRSAKGPRFKARQR
ncbi:type B 50S ribosomal protein L31 [Streptomyces griseorubiginosus]|uniref:type B 50S ribosomal protein L31 n=1 Tax=Streptomyces griseorubiginosus TaxID=67304 RepID=UPI0036CECA74